MKQIRLLIALPLTIVLILSGISVSTGKSYASRQTDQPSGEQLFMKYCKTCHQADGKGVRNMFPPLSGNLKVTGPPEDVIRIVLFGMEGPITVNEREYDQVMPPQGYLNDKQISDILSYVRSSWENKAAPVSQDIVATVRKQGKPQKD